MVMVETITRLVPGVLGDMRALIDDSHASGLIEYPHYTRPSSYRALQVPEVLLSGDHARVARWRREQALRRTSGETAGSARGCRVGRVRSSPHRVAEARGTRGRG